MPCGGETISRDKSTTICCGFIATETAVYGGCFSRFGFAAVFRGGNEVGIDENISIGYKGEFRFSYVAKLNSRDYILCKETNTRFA